MTQEQWEDLKGRLADHLSPTDREKIAASVSDEMLAMACGPLATMDFVGNLIGGESRADNWHLLSPEIRGEIVGFAT